MVLSVMDATRTHDFSKGRLRPGHEVRRIEALRPGVYEVEGIGPNIEVGDRLRFSLKGADTVGLELVVEQVRRQIIPTGGFVAQASTTPFESVEVQRGTLVCDRCERAEDLEITRLPEHTLEQAVAVRVCELGWVLEGEKHICPNCRD